MKSWINKVRAGHFAAIPENAGFNDDFALLIDGYDLAGGCEPCLAISNRVIAEIQATGSTTASALDLWIALFGQQRGYRFSGYPPEGEDLFILGLLVEALREALLALTPHQKAGIMSLVVPEKIEPQANLFDE